MRTTLAAKLYFGFGLMAALILGSAFFVLIVTKRALINYHDLNENMQGTAFLARAQSALWQLRYGFPQFMIMDANARTQILTDEPKWYKEIEEAFAAFSALKLTDEEKEGLASLRAHFKEYTEARPRWFDLYASGKLQEAAEWRAKTTTPFGAATVKAFSDLIELQRRTSVREQESIVAVAATTREIVVIYVFVALVLAAVAAFLIARSIVRPLGQLVTITEGISKGDLTRRMKLERDDELGTLSKGFDHMVEELTSLVGEVQKSGSQVSSVVTEIAATAKEHQATASETAATTIEIGATSKEISATSKELLKTMHEVSTVADESARLAGSGQAGLTRMEETMRQVMEAAGSINAKLTVLNEKAGNITHVVTTITKVADQTNLLSLNAAIEAEKAGEYGRGFAVVATEIRRLADQTAVATYDIEQMVKEIQSAVSAGVMSMDKFSEEVRRGTQEVGLVGAQLSQIIQQVQTQAPRFEAVNEGMKAQATGAEQISQALTQLSEAAQQTVESLRQSNQTMEGLNRVSSSLKNGISRFKLKA